MRQGFEVSERAKTLLTDNDALINRVIDNFTTFTGSQSGATIKYQVATLLQSAKNLSKELNKLINKSKGV